MLHWIYLALAIALAVYAAKLLVDGGVAISQRLGIPQFVIGAVVIGFGSSMPEFAVNVKAAMAGETGLALGNLLGSNLFNLCFTLALVAIITPVAVGRDSRVKDLPMHFIAALMIAVCGNQLYLDHIDYHQLMLSHGIILLCFFAIYLYYTALEVADNSPHKTPLHQSHHKLVKQEKTHSVAKACALMVIGLIGLVVGGELIVDQALEIATKMGMSEHNIGLLIVGPGTSIPELIACLIAARQRNTDMIVGNILGSNLFNIFFTLGVTAMIAPVPLDLALNKVVLMYLLVSLLLIPMVWCSKDKKLGRFSAVILLASYGFYLWVAISS